MTDVILHDGREITIDLYTFSNAEYMDIFKGDEDEQQAKGEALISRAAGLSLEEFRALAFPDSRKVYGKFFSKCRDVVKDPNSESASTSD